MYKDDYIEINHSEVLRHLGYCGQKITEKLHTDISRCREDILSAATPRSVYALFKLEKTNDGISLVSTDIVLTGGDISSLLGNAKECVLMAATLGRGVDKAIDYRQKTSMSDAVIMDTAATVAIEALCDAIQNRLHKTLPLTRRYSCGYGDLPLSLQPGILSALNAQKAIGLFCNSTSMMIPRKSVTAIMGIKESIELTQAETFPIQRSCLPGCRECQGCIYKPSRERYWKVKRGGVNHKYFRIFQKQHFGL